MAIKYRKLLAEYKIDNLSNPVLDKAFVAAATDFEEKLKNKEFTDEEIVAGDDKLVEMFNELHDFQEEDSDEVQQANLKAKKAEAKADIAEAKTAGTLADAINQLESVRAKYKKELPDILPDIDRELEKLKEKEKKQAKDQLFAVADDEIEKCPYNNLQALAEKYKQYPELVEKISARIEKLKPRVDEEELAEKLRSKREWSYKELESLGIKPTGNNMTIAGVRLEKEYLLNIYSVRR